MPTITPTPEPFDVRDLARLATEMFNAHLGGDAPWLATAPALGGIGASPVSHPAPPPPASLVPHWGASVPALSDSVPAWGGIGVTPGSQPAPAPPLPQGALSIPALSESVPGEAELRALLAVPVAPVTAVPPAATSYYFLDDAQGPPSGVGGPHSTFDVAAIRRDFPILGETVNGRPLIWLDNAATTQKPNAVIDRLSSFYRHENSNIHRGAHALAARATDAYEAARDKVRRFLKAPSADEIVFVRGATEGINLVAQSWGRRFIAEGDEIVIPWLEHHANIVPWQQLCRETGARLLVAPVDDQGQVLLDEYGALLGPRTKLVSLTQVSNALGTVVPARRMIEMAQRVGARVLVDGAQAVSHMAVDVQALGCDWYVFSGHKVFAPTGIGAVFAKAELLEAAPPWQGGGNMIRDVTFERTEYQQGAAKFEAGTGNIADAVGLGAAIDYVEAIGMEVIGRYEHELVAAATRGLSEIPGLRIIGTAADKAGVVSFVLDGIPSEEVGGALNREGIAVRSGHHCAQPILRRFGLDSTVRPSFAFYNTFAEIDALVAAVRRIRAGSQGPL